MIAGMNLYQLMCVFGFPTVFITSVGVFHRKMAEQRKQSEALRYGVQALLQDRLLQGYRFYIDKGWIDYSERKVYENLYEQYHALGQNGIMTSYYNTVLALPAQDPSQIRGGN